MPRSLHARNVRKTASRLVVFVWLLVVLLLGAVTLPTTRIYEDALRPEFDRNATALADVIGAEVQRAAEAGIPLDGLVDLKPFVSDVVEGHPEVRRVTLTDAAGRTLFSQSFGAAGEDEITTRALPVIVGGRTVATVGIGIASDYLADAVADIGFDVLTILLVAVLITFEILIVLVAMRLSNPIAQLLDTLRDQSAGQFRSISGSTAPDEIGGAARALDRITLDLNARYAALLALARRPRRDRIQETEGVLQRLAGALAPEGRPERAVAITAADIRLPLFLFFLSTELSRAFLPLFAESLYTPLFGLGQSVVIALPMTVYVLASMVMTPMAGGLVERHGARTIFLAGLIPTIVSLLGQGLAGSVLVLAIWRAVEGIGFALVSIAALNHIQEASQESERARGSVIYSAAFVTAGICGTSVGGILADRIGYGSTLLVAGGLSLVSALLVYAALPARPGTHRVVQGMRGGDVWRALSAPRFLAASVLLALPAQLIAAGFIYYATPLLLHDAGVSTSAIGRIVMAYFLTNVVASRLVAVVADRSNRHSAFAAGGLALAGVGAVLPGLFSGSEWLVLGIALVGVAQALGGPSRGAIMLAECGQIPGVAASPALSVFRLIERSGALAGPMVAAALIPKFGYQMAVLILGVTVTTAAIGYLLASSRWHGPGAAGLAQASGGKP